MDFSRRNWITFWWRFILIIQDIIHVFLGTRRRWIFWCWGASCPFPYWSHHHGDTYPKCSWRAWQTNPWIDCFGSKTFWICFWTNWGLFGFEHDLKLIFSFMPKRYPVVVYVLWPNASLFVISWLVVLQFDVLVMVSFLFSEPLIFYLGCLKI